MYLEAEFVDAYPPPVNHVEQENVLTRGGVEKFGLSDLADDVRRGKFQPSAAADRRDPHRLDSDMPETVANNDPVVAERIDAAPQPLKFEERRIDIPGPGFPAVAKGWGSRDATVMSASVYDEADISESSRHTKASNVAAESAQNLLNLVQAMPPLQVLELPKDENALPFATTGAREAYRAMMRCPHLDRVMLAKPPRHYTGVGINILIVDATGEEFPRSSVSRFVGVAAVMVSDIETGRGLSRNPTRLFARQVMCSPAIWRRRGTERFVYKVDNEEPLRGFRWA